MSKISEEQKDRVREMYLTGLGVSTIAMRLKIVTSAVHGFLRQEGLLRGRAEGYWLRVQHNRNNRRDRNELV